MTIAAAIVTSRAPILSFMAMGMCWGGFAAYVPELRLQLGINDAFFGTILLGSAVGLVTAMWLAPRIDRLFGTAALPVLTALLGLTLLGPAIATQPWLFAFGMICAGLASGLMDIIMNSRVAGLEAAHKRPLMNINHALFSFTYAASAIAAGLSREAGISPGEFFLAIACVCTVVAFWTGSPGEIHEGGHKAENGTSLRLLIAAGGIVLVAFMIENSVEIWSALHIERTLGGRAAEGAMAAAILGLTMGVGRLSGQVVAERLPERKVLVWAAVITSVGLFVAAAAPTPLVAYVGFGLTGLGVSVIAPMALAIGGRAAPQGQRTRVIARISVIGFLGFLASPLIMGGLSQAVSLSFALAAMAMTLVAVPLLLRRIG